MTMVSKDLTPGTRLRYIGGNTDSKTVTIKERKDDDSGWWLTDNDGGLCDSVIDDSPAWIVERSAHDAEIHRLTEDAEYWSNKCDAVEKQRDEALQRNVADIQIIARLVHYTGAIETTGFDDFTQNRLDSIMEAAEKGVINVL